MNLNSGRKLRASLAFVSSVVLAAFAVAQNAPSTTAPASTTTIGPEVKMEKFEVTGSFIPQATAAPIAPVAIFSENEIRSTGAATPIEALRYLPSFIGNPGATEFDSNGGDGSTFVSLRGLGASQTLTLINGRPAGDFANFSLIPTEAIERIEVLRDGAGIIYGSAAIGGAVNVILKTNYSGLTVDLYGGAATRTPGDRATFEGSFVSGANNSKTSIVASGSYFKDRTIFASERPNSANADNRSLGGTNTGSQYYPGRLYTDGGATPMTLPPGFSSSTSATLADYVPLDTNAFSSNQLFNFRQYSPSAPGQKRNSLYTSFEHKAIGDNLVVFGSFIYSKLKTLNGLAPAPFALDAEPTYGGPLVGSLTSFGPYNRYGTPSQILFDYNDVTGDDDYFLYRSVEIGDRTEEQVYNDFRYQGGIKGDIGSDWKWESAVTVENENWVETDSGVVDLTKLDALVSAGKFNPFATAFSKGTATIGGTSYSWDNTAALKAAEATDRVVNDSNDHTWDARVSGKVADLPGGALQIAAGYEYRSGNSSYSPDSLYATGGVLGLNGLTPSYNEFDSKSIFAEVQIPIISDANKLPFVKDLSIGLFARNEKHTVYGMNQVTNLWDQKSFSKTNPSVNLQYSPTDELKIRGTWSKGYNAPGAGTLFASAGTDNPTLVDPLGFPYKAQTAIVVRGNSNLQPATSKAWSLGFVAAPKSLLNGFNFTVDFYNVEVDGIVGNNAKAILAANAAGQGSGFVSGNAATINPNAPFASQIKRSSNGALNTNGTFAATPGLRGAVLSDYQNVASRKVSGIEYTVDYTQNTTDYGRFTYTLAANEFLKFDQQNGPGLPNTSYLGKFVSTVGDALSPGSIQRWKANFIPRWNWKNFEASVTVNYIAKYQDDPLFVLSPQMQAYYNAGTPKSDPTYAAFLAKTSSLAPKVGGTRYISAMTTFDTQVAYKFNSDLPFLKGLKVIVGARNVTDKLAPFAAGAFNDSYDTRTTNNVGRFVYMDLREEF
jgi:iron complex outermembrane receptor protein